MCVGGWRVRSLIRKLEIPNFIQKREKLNFALSNEQPPLSLTEIADIWFYSRQGVKWNWVSRCLVPDFTSHLLLQSTLSQVTGITVIKMTSAADYRQEGASLSVHVTALLCQCLSSPPLRSSHPTDTDWASWADTDQCSDQAARADTGVCDPGWPRGLGTLFTRPCHNT